MRLRTEAGQAAALAVLLDKQAGVLQKLDDARARHLAHTAVTRVKAERAKAVLAERHAADPEPEQQVTAQEWLDIHHQAVDEEERHREITDADVLDVDPVHDDRDPHDKRNAGDELDADRDTTGRTADDGAWAHCDHGERDDSTTGHGPRNERDIIEPDLREVTAAEPAQRAEDVVRVPSPHEVSDAVERASRSLAEIRAREQLDEQAGAEHRAEELTRWHAQDQAAEQEALDEQAADNGDGDGTVAADRFGAP
jgi:hypothetical protein